MVNKKVLLFLLLSLFFVPLTLAVSNDGVRWNPFGDFSFSEVSFSMEFVEMVIFVCVFIFFLAIIYEMVSLVGFIEQTWMKLVVSVIVLLLINTSGFIYKSVLFLKDIQNIINWITSLTLARVGFILVIFVLVSVLLFALHSLVSQWRRDAVKEVREQEARKTGMRRKIEKIKRV